MPASACALSHDTLELEETPEAIQAQPQTSCSYSTFLSITHYSTHYSSSAQTLLGKRRSVCHVLIAVDHCTHQSDALHCEVCPALAMSTVLVPAFGATPPPPTLYITNAEL